jgi:hypothetical protein
MQLRTAATSFISMPGASLATGRGGRVERCRIQDPNPGTPILSVTRPTGGPIDSQSFSVKSISTCLLVSAVVAVPSVSQASPRDTGCHDTGENAHFYPNETVGVNAG